MTKTLAGRYQAFLYEKNLFTDLLSYLEQRSRVKRQYICAGGVSLIGLNLLFGFGASLLCNLIGFVYPAYTSVQAIESNNKDDDTQWLTYWVVYGIFSVVEYFSEMLLYWFPFYYAAKCVFLLWCMASVSWNGSQLIYTRLVRPFFLRHEERLDS